MVNAVDTRIELDLRIGAAFTRMQCLNLQILDQSLSKMIFSYGSCQFPTLGFIVDRYFRVQNFVPESYWAIHLRHTRDNVTVSFSWKRTSIFDRMTAIILYERCLLSKKAVVENVATRPTSRWRPLPLTTVELQKLGSRFLGMSSQNVLKIAEDLYTKGFLSYPRTETDQFDSNIDLKALIQKQTQDPTWGQYSQGLLDGRFKTPRGGKNNDKAHPPIHPIAWVSRDILSTPEHKKVYDLVTRRFLACCSDDAKGELSTVDIKYGEEKFHASGVRVLERNYLDVYPFDKWESSQQLPSFEVGELFVPTEATLDEGKTGPPGYVTEPELLGLMDANGIGTDATMAEHIEKIISREYVIGRPQGSGGTRAVEHGPSDGTGTRGGRGRGRGSRGGRGNSNASTGRGNGNQGVKEFMPTVLGVALIEGYDRITAELDLSFSKPFLRKKMEADLAMICSGAKSKEQVVRESIVVYKDIFVRTVRSIDVLKDTVRQRVLAA
jgi:DNA topoisomerase-3